MALSGRVPKPYADRVDSSAGPSACWRWLGGHTTAGYGLWSLWGAHLYAHRVALEQKIWRSLTRHEYACHTCDNKGCVNPDHLYVGSATTNGIDAVARGQWANGS